MELINHYCNEMRERREAESAESSKLNPKVGGPGLPGNVVEQQRQQ